MGFSPRAGFVSFASPLGSSFLKTFPFKSRSVATPSQSPVTTCFVALEKATEVNPFPSFDQAFSVAPVEVWAPSCSTNLVKVLGMPSSPAATIQSSSFSGFSLEGSSFHNNAVFDNFAALPEKVLNSFLVFTFQALTDASAPAVAILSPSGAKAAAKTYSV